VKDIDIGKIKEQLGEITVEEYERLSEMPLRKGILITLTCTFLLVLIATITLCFFNGFGLTKVDNKVLITLIGATAGEFASLILVGFKYLFRF